jgi:hypothetical protein
MKAEERHELRENDLASWLHYGLWAFLKQNGSYILLVLALGFLGYQLWNMYQRKQEIARLNAWNDLRVATESPDATTYVNKLRVLVAETKLKEVKAQAYLDLGYVYDRLLAYPEDLNRLQLGPDEALNKAYDAFQQALQLHGDDVLLSAKAHLGMAAVAEDRGQWDQALGEYKKLTDPASQYANTAFAALAQQRIDTLDDRKNAPQLAASFRTRYSDEQKKMSLPPASTLPAGLPNLQGLMNTPESSFPGLFPPKRSTPATPATAPGPVVPFVGPTIPGIAPPGTPAPEAATQPQ